MPIRKQQDQLLRLIAGSPLFCGESRDAARRELETSVALQQIWDEAVLECVNLRGVPHRG